MRNVNIWAPSFYNMSDSDADHRFGHGIAVDGNGGSNPVYNVTIRYNSIQSVGGARDQASGLPLRYRFEGVEVGDAVHHAIIVHNQVI